MPSPKEFLSLFAIVAVINAVQFRVGFFRKNVIGLSEGTANADGKKPLYV